MNCTDYYITPTDYDTAAQNGISPVRLDYRIRSYAWDKQRAITTPPAPYGVYSEWLKVAKSNGIHKSVFYTRMKQYGWTPERAATQPTTEYKPKGGPGRRRKTA